MAANPLRIGVIGAGIMGADHVRTLEGAVTGAHVQLVADLDVERAKGAIEGIHDAQVTDDPLALIADSRVDAVLIASHDSTHAEFTRAAVRAGKPVLCEKPLAPTLAEASQLRRDVGADADLVRLGFMRRFDPGHTELRAAILDRSVGRPLLLHCVSRGVSSAPGTTAESSVTNSAIHELDSVPWLLGSPVVQASFQTPLASPELGGLQDPALILLRTADGVLTTCETFLNARYGYDIRCEVVGEHGAVSLTQPVRVITDALRGRSIGYAADWRPRFADAYRLELQAWIDGLQYGRTSQLASIDDGIAASRVAAAVIASMHSGGAFVDVESEAQAVR